MTIMTQSSFETAMVVVPPTEAVETTSAMTTCETERNNNSKTSSSSSSLTMNNHHHRRRRRRRHQIYFNNEINNNGRTTSFRNHNNNNNNCNDDDDDIANSNYHQQQRHGKKHRKSSSSLFWLSRYTKSTLSVTMVAIVSILCLVGVVMVLTTNDSSSTSSTIHELVFRQLQQQPTNGENTTDDSSSSSLSVNVTFEDILKTVVFLIATWGAANSCQLIGLPSLAGEIVVGMVLGPPVLDFCPYPEAMVLIGNFGLIGLILNSGIDLDIAQLRETGTRAVMIAVSGTTLALSTGIGVSYVVATDAAATTIFSAFATGAIFSPSSWGVASQVLSKGEVLNTPTGQTIMASSVVDDILGLILLSILEVFVMPDPTAFDYIKPFLASFGYLIVLGGLGITVIPKVIENHVLPKFPPHKQDFVAIAMMFCLMTAYLPLMFYSGASFLTGAFLAGVSFSQLHHVHATFANSSREVMVWLMRIFFAATIGFQVPATYFKDPTVLKKGAIFLIPILSKFPLGFLIPRFQREIPADFPYDPYWRDMWITSLSMLCRGEFNFVVASVSLQAGLLSAEQYAGTVFAVLTSSIVGPLILSRVIAYYNQKSLDYLDASHPIKRIGSTDDGYRPLFLAIQARTPVHWGTHDKLKQALEETGLIIIDHRSWHTMGLTAVNVTEIFCQDKEIQVKIRGCFATESTTDATSTRSKARTTEARTSRIRQTTPSSLAETFASSEGQSENGPDVDFQILVAERKAEIEETIAAALGLDPSEYAIQVSEWQTFSFDQQDVENGTTGESKEEKGYCFHSSIPQNNPEQDVGIDGGTPETIDFEKPSGWKPTLFRSKSNASSAELSTTPKPKLHRGVSNASSTAEGKSHHRTASRGHRRIISEAGSVINIGEDPVLTGLDLWETDEGCHDLAREGYYQTPKCDGTTAVQIEEGCTNGTGNRSRANSSFHNADASGSFRFTDTEDPSTPRVGDDSPTDRELREDNLPSIPRPARIHHRSVTFDASQLVGHNNLHDWETEKIRERLHGYVRP